jgi:hypothetical protein
VIVGMLVPPSGASVCLYTPSMSGPFLSTGTVDLSLTREYTPTLLVENRLVTPGSTCRACGEPIVIIDSATVRVTNEDGTDLDDFTVPGDGFAQDATGAGPSLTTYTTTLVSTAAADKLGTFSGTKHLVSHVKLFGRSSTGDHVESDEQVFSIDACVGCLCDPTATSAPCVVGQDQVVACP